MALIRHRQRAITALTGNDSKWINPQKYEQPREPIFALPLVYYQLEAPPFVTNADIFRAGAGTTYDLNTLAGQPWQLLFKYRLRAATGANQVIFQQAGTIKRLIYHNLTGQFRWTDGAGGSTNFADIPVQPIIDQWYLVHLRNDLDVPGNVKLQLFTLPSVDQENGDLQGEQSLLADTGTQSSILPYIGAESVAGAVLGTNADLANVIWGINDVAGSYDDFIGSFQHHWPMNEGVGTVINDITTTTPSAATPGDGLLKWGFN